MSHLLALACVLVTIQQQAPPASAPASRPSADPPLLSGPPAVEDGAGKLTLVRRTFDGKIESVGPQPDAVAIAMLDLTAEQRAKYDEINSARLIVFDNLIRENYGLVVEIASLQGETDTARRRELLQRIHLALRPYTDRGTFFSEMWPHLTDAQREQVRKMVDEYTYERLEALRREAGENVSPKGLAVRDRLQMLGQMVRESIERQVGLERENFEAFSQELALTPEQHNAAQAIFQPLAARRFQKQEVTREEQAAAWAEFNKLLTPAQRQKLFSMLVRRYQPRDAAAPPASSPASQPAPAGHDEMSEANEKNGQGGGG